MAGCSSRMTLHDDEHEPNQELVKCVVVGDTGVGKTKLVCAQACGTVYSLKQLMQTQHVSTVWAIDHYKFDREVLNRSWLMVDDASVSLRLWDTFGYHDKDRKFAYGSADVILVCFSLVKPMSLRNVRSVWYPEIKKLCPGTPMVLVGCQADLRYLYNEETFLQLDKGPFFKKIVDSDIITPDMGRSVAKEIGSSYYESSVMTRYGVADVFSSVIRLALLQRRRNRFWMAHLKHVQKPLLQLPLLPPKPKFPVATINRHIPTLQDFSSLLESQFYADVIFKVGRHSVPAHKLILISASYIFRDLFTMELRTMEDCETHYRTPAIERGQISDTNLLLDQNNDEISISNSWNGAYINPSGFEMKQSPDNDKQEKCKTRWDTACGNFEAFRHITEQQIEDLSNPNITIPQTIITLNEAISLPIFQYILKYLYTGIAAEHDDILPEVKKAAELLQLYKLVAMVTNLLNEESFLNVEIQRTFYDQRRQEFGELLKSGHMSDITFELDDGTVMAHKPILVMRCEMMAAMFNDNFKEGSAKLVPFPNVTTASFKALLEYIYCGECYYLHELDIIELIELANRLCLPHLVALAECQIIKQLTCSEDCGEEITEEVFYLLEPAQLYNAKQLAGWCLHYLSVNFSKTQRKFYKLLHNLAEENQMLVTKKRWPPLWYLKELDFYKSSSSELERKSKDKKKSTRKRSSSGCLCFSNRRQLRTSFRQQTG